MKLSTYIAQLESILNAHGDLDVFISNHANGLSGQGLVDLLEPPVPQLTPLVLRQGDVERMYVNEGKKKPSSELASILVPAGSGVKLL